MLASCVVLFPLSQQQLPLTHPRCALVQWYVAEKMREKEGEEKEFRE